jgi:MOSC domain-containing protein YiiM
MSQYKVLGVFTGKVETLFSNVQSAIVKRTVDTIFIGKHLIHGDEVADTKDHGGDMRVVHHYSNENYNYLKEKFPDIAERFVPGSFGENILTEKLTETELNIGDIYSLGSAKIQLTVPRRPCSTINYSYRDDRVFKEAMSAGRTGWFYRVLEEGEVREGDHLKFLERPFPNMSVSRLYEQGYGKKRFWDKEFLGKCLNTGLMDINWKNVIEVALKS